MSQVFRITPKRIKRVNGFKKAAELTYYVINEKSIDDLSYDIKEAFSYFQIAVPDTFRESIDGEINKLGDIVIGIVSFIKKNGQRNMKWT